MKIIAHRGASYDAPENTLASIRLAWEQGADGVEIDVRLSRDGYVVVMHDEDTLRTCGRRMYVHSRTVDELKKLDAGSWKRAQFSGEHIPTLSEVLAILPVDKELYIEVKCGLEIAEAISSAIDASGVSASNLRFIGFSFNVMAGLKRHIPSLKTCWILDLDCELEECGVDYDFAQYIELVKSAGLDGLSVGGDINLCCEAVAMAASAGVFCNVWTVDEPSGAAKLIASGASSITSNRPKYLQENL
jgi:glycerophosphoryl diester phosphodiesterase